MTFGWVPKLRPRKPRVCVIRVCAYEILVYCEKYEVNFFETAHVVGMLFSQCAHCRRSTESCWCNKMLTKHDSGHKYETSLPPLCCTLYLRWWLWNAVDWVEFGRCTVCRHHQSNLQAQFNASIMARFCCWFNANTKAHQLVGQGETCTSQLENIQHGLFCIAYFPYYARNSNTLWTQSTDNQRKVKTIVICDQTTVELLQLQGPEGWFWRI